MPSQCWPYIQSFCNLKTIIPPPTIDDGDLAFISHFIMYRVLEVKLIGNTALTSRCLRTIRRYTRLESLELTDVDIFIIERDGTTAFPELALSQFTRLQNLTLQVRLLTHVVRSRHRSGG